MAKKKTNKVNQTTTGLKKRVFNVKSNDSLNNAELFSDQTKRDIALFNKYTEGYIQSLKDFQDQCEIKKVSYSKEVGKYWEFLHDRLMAYKKAMPFMTNYTLGSEYSKIISFIGEELQHRLNNSEIEGSPIDLSDSSAVEKIIFLKELGILDFLKNKDPFKSSINRLATVLSAITSEKSETLQSSLNAMHSEKVDKKNDPYKSNKTVQKVKDKLINIGFTAN